MNRAECLAAGSQQTGGYPGISLQADRSHLGREGGGGCCGRMVITIAMDSGVSHVTVPLSWNAAVSHRQDDDDIWKGEVNWGRGSNPQRAKQAQLLNRWNPLAQS